MGRQPLLESVDSSWLPILRPHEATLEQIGERLRAEIAAGRAWLPADGVVLRAFQLPLPDVRVLIVGQDPYPTPGHPVGLSFSVAPDVQPLPRSLQNIYSELHSDLGVEPSASGDLTAWSLRGVMLLNRVLTVGNGQPGSHRGWGWEEITDAAVSGLAARGGPLVAILWGKDAQAVSGLLGNVPIIASAHPSPLSAYRGFFGSRPFSRANQLLIESGAKPINWSTGSG
ncbi:MAG: uracil-DNA glycosylase [Actinobacteria bacterium]|nr:uracil-DNA glycosylase [Actinomycetota bacterium]